MAAYDERFFSTFQESSRRSAEIILPDILEVTGARSLLDVGCGLGIWLDVARGLGLDTIIGIDGGEVDPGLRSLGASEFIHCDLSGLDPSRPPVTTDFDLALCLEVAEHLDEERRRSSRPVPL